MKVSTLALKKAAAKKRARKGPSEGEQPPSRKRQVAQASEPAAPEEPAPALEVDLTADTPPGAVVAEGGVATESNAEGQAAMGEHPLDQPTVERPRQWGEGPSGATAPSPERVSASSPTRVEPEAAEGAEERRGGPGPGRDSVLNDGKWAERLISSIIVPEVQEELSHLKASEFFRESYAALIKVANSLSAAKEVIHGGKTLMRESRREAEEARASAAAAEGALEAARAEAKTQKDRAEAEANRLRAALNQLGQAESAIEARNLQMAELSSALRAAEDRAAKAEDRAAGAEDRAAKAQEESEQSREAERSVKALLSAAEARAAEVEATMEARVARALEEFRSSKSFEAEVAEASAEAYLQGFQSGKEKVARDLNLPQALEVEPESLSEIASDDETAPADP